MPRTAVAGTASSTPATNEPVACTSAAVMKAPSMESEPCARLIMSMMPNTSVSPAASRNSIRPNCTPFSVCSRMRTQDMPRGGRRTASTCLLHRAILHVGVAVVLEDRSDSLVDDAPLRIPADDAQVVVLDRVLVAVEQDYRNDLQGPRRRLRAG